MSMEMQRIRLLHGLVIAGKAYSKGEVADVKRSHAAWLEGIGAARKVSATTATKPEKPAGPDATKKAAVV